MRQKVRHYLIIGLGWFFVVLGILGLFLPVLQGILFLCIGVILLSGRSPRVRLLMMKLGQRYPKFRKALNTARSKAHQWRERLPFRHRKQPGEG